jgi:fatty-acyl-CoA synthase
MDTATLAYWPADTRTDLLDLTVGDALRAAAAEAPDQVAIVEGHPAPGSRRTLTYQRLLVDAEQVARALLARFRPGEHVAVWAGNCVEWIVLEYGAGLAGLVLVTINPAYQAGELAYVLRQSRSVGLFHMSSFRGNPMTQILADIRPALPELREVVPLDDWDTFVGSAEPAVALPAVNPFDDAQIQYTSGTTGSPKGVLLHHHGLVNNARLVSQRWAAGPGDVLVWPLPLFHTAGAGVGVLGALAARATLVVLTQFDPALHLELIESERGTIICGSPAILIALLDHPDSATRDLSTLRVVSVGGAPMPTHVAREWERRNGVRFSIMFGTTECSPIVTMTRLDDPPDTRTATIGTALPHTEVMIADPATGGPVPTDTIGELCARGYLVMHGYFDDPEATAAAVDADGWYHTGDLATMDPDGCLRIEGRLTDMIIRGGENISPREIENLLHTHSAVAEAAVVGKPDPLWGETVAAFIRPKTGAAVTDAELHTYCREHLAPYKTPHTWIFVDAFPVTASGKIRKDTLRTQLTA